MLCVQVQRAHHRSSTSLENSSPYCVGGGGGEGEGGMGGARGREEEEMGGKGREGEMEENTGKYHVYAHFGCDVEKVVQDHFGGFR